MAQDLYPNALLALAADIAHVGPLTHGPDARIGRARKRSMVCGSEVEVALALDDQGRIASLGLDVEACALGQASASIFSRQAIGASREEVEAGRDALEALLQEGASVDETRFAELQELTPVREYPRRHASTLLVWRAALAAFDAALGLDDATLTTSTRSDRAAPLAGGDTRAVRSSV